MKSLRSGQWAERSRFGLVLLLIASCFLGGGASRLDIPSLIILQPMAVLIVAALLLIPGEIRWRAVHAPLLFLAALAAVMVVQLIPLPPAIWQALPGRSQFMPLVREAGVTNVWRPLSLTPDLTAASLIGLVMPAAGLIAFASLSEERTQHVLLYLLIAVGVSVLFGIAQLAGGPHTAFYRYAVTNEGSAVGLFANRNHQALLLAMTWPMLAIWALGSRRDGQQGRQVHRLLAASAMIALIPLVIVTGSRGGLMLATIGLAVSGWIVTRKASELSLFIGWGRVSPKTVAIVGAAILGAAVLVTVFASRDEAFQRLFSTNVSGELRFEFLPVLLRIAGDFMPFGTGFGSFDPVFRFYEPDAMVSPFYLNHAHNDWLELLMTGGIPAVALGVIFATWAMLRFASSRAWRLDSRRQRYAFLAFALLLLCAIASALDYPLRTPIHALIFSFASAWLAATALSHTRPRIP